MAMSVIGIDPQQIVDDEDARKKKALDDRISQLRGTLGDIPSATPLAPAAHLGAEGPSYQARDLSGSLPGYDAIRNRVSNQANAAGQTANDALTRRYAAMGGQNGGAFIKQQQQLISDSQDKKQEALSGVDTQEQQDRRDQLAKEYDKEYQSSEAAKGRSFQRDVYNSDQDFKTASYNNDLAFKDKVFKFDSNSKLAQLQLSMEQMINDREDTEYSKQLAKYQQDHSGGLLGAGGVLGTGIGA